MQNILEELRHTLESDERLIIEGQLVKNKVVELALALDAKLITLLLSNESIKKQFFKKIGDVLVFDKVAFQSFVSNKQFLPDSYTAFKNKIGLTTNGEYITESKEVVLAWPYKDCILEGGQTKEDQKRKEIFWNETLAPDEIDRLLAPKALCNFKKHDKDGEHKVENISLDDNLIINGNNLLALQSLNNRYSGSVKLIYIDPPFNTGNDEFKYNDSFNHSTWLTFMKNRLVSAKSLMLKEGVIVVHVGNEEASYTQVLLDEIFGRNNYLNHITMTTNAPSGFKATSAKIFSTANHIYIYANDSSQEQLNKIYVSKQYDKAYKYYLKNPEEEFPLWKYCNVIDAVAVNEGYEDTKSFKKSISKMELSEKIAEFSFNNKNRVFRTAALGGGALKKRKDTVLLSKEKKSLVMQHPNEDVENFYILNGEMIVFWSNTFKDIDKKHVPAQALTDVWTDIGFTGIANEGGVTLKNGKKPELLLKRIIELATNENDIVLDYHLGSGTTCAVAHKMRRRYIGIEQLNYDKNDSVVRLKNVINGDKSGASKLTEWKGGGSFIYCELTQHNANTIDEIEKANTIEALKLIWQKIESTDFISYKINPETINESIHEFEDLSLAKQKQFLIAVLDKNQLYVNYSDIDDEDYQISESDKKLNKQFYGES